MGLNYGVGLRRALVASSALIVLSAPVVLTPLPSPLHG
jgi:hypothetical protein